jgi:lipid A 3-O-deacylase
MQFIFHHIGIGRIAAMCIMLLVSMRLSAAPPREMSHRDSVFIKQMRLKLEAGFEYIVPYQASRQIKTVSINIYPGVQLFQKVHLSLHAGITATYAWGSIIQYGQNFQDVSYQTAALGIGPGVLIRFEPLIAGRFSLSVDVAEKLLFYTEHFPAGGDIYNFMTSLGGSICYRITKREKVSFGGRWMHVSNGQGLTQHNPSYEGAGVNISVIHYF